MEQNQTMPEQPVSTQVVPAPKKKNSAMALVIILLLLIAAGGVGFGVWAMMDGNAREETAKKQCSSSSTSIINCDVDSTNTDNVSVDTKEYIYIGEWGLKIKIPDTLSYVSYKFNNFGDGVANLGVRATTGSGELPDFANPLKNSEVLGYVSRIKKDTYNEMQEGVCGWDSNLVFSDGDYNYCVSLSQAYYSTSAEELELEKQARTTIGEMLGNAENYSKF